MSPTSYQAALPRNQWRFCTRGKCRRRVLGVQGSSGIGDVSCVGRQPWRVLWAYLSDGGVGDSPVGESPSCVKAALTVRGDLSYEYPSRRCRIGPYRNDRRRAVWPVRMNPARIVPLPSRESQFTVCVAGPGRAWSSRRVRLRLARARPGLCQTRRFRGLGSGRRSCTRWVRR